MPLDRAPLLLLSDVAELLNISASQVYALVRRGDLQAVKIGGRGQWRVEPAELDAYHERARSDARKFIDEHPFVEGKD
jgi:excisionase family DNA binding protein